MTRIAIFFSWQGRAIIVPQANCFMLALAVIEKQAKIG
jgi:hypothetical protein